MPPPPEQVARFLGALVDRGWEVRAGAIHSPGGDLWFPHPAGWHTHLGNLAGILERRRARFADPSQLGNLDPTQREHLVRVHEQALEAIAIATEGIHAARRSPALPAIDVRPVDASALHETPMRVERAADALLTLLLRRAPAHLESEVADDGRVIWRVEPVAGAAEIVETSTTGFRTILARFGHHYLDGQVYGGTGQRIVRFEAGEYRLSCDLANDQQSGFRLRMTAYEHGGASGLE